jgi:hypothetical protein
MAFRSLFLSLLIASFNIIATSTVANVRTWISPIHAEAEEEVLEETEDEDDVEEASSILLDRVLVNNALVEISEENKVQVTSDDAVRISGIAEPEAVLSVFVDEKEIKTTTLRNRTWFVLFSITNMEDGEYPVTALLEENEGERIVELLTLVVGEGGDTVKPTLDPTLGFLSNLGVIPTSALFFTSIALSLTLGCVLGIRIERKRKEEKKKKD